MLSLFSYIFTRLFTNILKDWSTFEAGFDAFLGRISCWSDDDLIFLFLFDGMRGTAKLVNATRSKDRKEAEAQLKIAIDSGERPDDAILNRFVGIFAIEAVPHCIKLLRARFINFIISPGEAEHQAAFMEQCDLLDAHLTRDSDYTLLMCEAVIFDTGRNLWSEGAELFAGPSVVDDADDNLLLKLSATKAGKILAPLVENYGFMALRLYGHLVANDYHKIAKVGPMKVLKAMAAALLKQDMKRQPLIHLDAALELVCTELVKTNEHLDALATLNSLRRARIMFAAGLVFDTVTQQLVRMDVKQPLNVCIYSDDLVDEVICKQMYATVNMTLYTQGGCDVATGETLVATGETLVVSSGSLIRSSSPPSTAMSAAVEGDAGSSTARAASQVAPVVVTEVLIKGWNVMELKKYLTLYGLSVSGLKANLQAAALAHLATFGTTQRPQEDAASILTARMERETKAWLMFNQGTWLKQEKEKFQLATEVVRNFFGIRMVQSVRQVQIGDTRHVDLLELRLARPDEMPPNVEHGVVGMLVRAKVSKSLGADVRCVLMICMISTILEYKFVIAIDQIRCLIPLGNLPKKYTPCRNGEEGDCSHCRAVVAHMQELSETAGVDKKNAWSKRSQHKSIDKAQLVHDVHFPGLSRNDIAPKKIRDLGNTIEPPTLAHTPAPPPAAVTPVAAVATPVPPPAAITPSAAVANGARHTGASEEYCVEYCDDFANMVVTRADYVPFLPDDYTEIRKGPFGSAFEEPFRKFLAYKQEVLDDQHAQHDSTKHLVGRPLKASRLFTVHRCKVCHQVTAYIYDKGLTNKTLLHKHRVHTFVPIKSQKRQMAFASATAKTSRKVAQSRIVIEQLNRVLPPPNAASLSPLSSL